MSGHAIAQPQKRTEDLLCLWRSCTQRVPDGRAPLCEHHRLKTWAVIEIDRGNTAGAAQ